MWWITVCTVDPHGASQSDNTMKLLFDVVTACLYLSDRIYYNLIPTLNIKPV
jgi:hypothetical protein